MSMPDAVKAVSGKKPAAGKKHTAKKKPAAKKKAVKKKAPARKKAVGKVSAPKKQAPPRKVKIKLKPGKKGGTINLGISGVSINKVTSELAHQRSLADALKKHQAMLKVPGKTPGEKATIKRDIQHYKNAIKASKQHVTALKRSI